jgi:phosphoribosylglycinamide formyltransferase 1
MNNLVILISGSGSNMKAIVQRCQQAQWLERFQARVSLVVSTTENSSGLVWARDMGLNTQVISPQAHPQLSPQAARQAFEGELCLSLDAQNPVLIILAGFMRILSAETVERYAHKMINIHPSLLPSFTGLHTHERVLKAGCKFHGATVHWVTAQLDAGAIIDQVVVPVLAHDTPQTLAQRVLTQEHLLYPRVIERWLDKGLEASTRADL